MAEVLVDHGRDGSATMDGTPSIQANRAAGKGGPAFLLGLRLWDPVRLVRRVEQGLSYRALERFQKTTRLSTNEVADLVVITLRTLHRRKEQGRLAPDESDRLLRASRVFAKALELFEGDIEAARTWLNAPAKALGGERPLALARTDLGCREVETLIDRLEHGVLT